MFQNLKRFASDDSAATAIEYGLIASLVCVAAIGGFLALGDSSNGLFHKAFIVNIIPALSGTPAVK
jgi:pilus assembly protein Flp/PilA